MKFLFIMALSVISLIANAEIKNFTFKAKVQSFSEKEVILEVEGKEMTVKRSAIQEKKFMSGDSVHVKLTGTDLGPAKTKSK